MKHPEGTPVAVSGGYDFEPAWLGARPDVTGRVAKWIPGQNSQSACVVALDEPLTATWEVRGRREERTAGRRCQRMSDPRETV